MLKNDMKRYRENKRVKPKGDTWTKKRLRELMGSYSESKYDATKLLPEIERQSKEQASWTAIPMIDGLSLWVPGSTALSTAS